MGLKKQKRAAALKWDKDRNNAPRLIASGKGVLAERILALAEEAGLPVREDPILSAALEEVEPGSEIPEELYRLAAELYIFLMELENGELRDS